MEIKQETLETERLILRPLDLNDANANAVQKFAGNYNIAKTTVNIPHPYEDGMAEEWISLQEKRWTDEDLVNFAIIKKQTDQLIGVVGLVGRKEHEGGIGYWIGEPFWRNGYCTEATKALIDFCFKNLNIDRLEAEYLVTNPASGRVMEKAGMTFEGTKTIKDRDGDDAQLNVYEIYKNRN